MSPIAAMDHYAHLATDTITGTPKPLHQTNKRLIVCCDGTWKDGVAEKERWKYTNVMKLARAINQRDERAGHVIPQLVFYQPGIGSSANLYSHYLQGATGASLVEKVQEAYAFIAHNFEPGDEIFLFGFSRGAYTARMVAMFIGAIGVLDRVDMEHFGNIFVSFQRLGKSDDTAEIAKLHAALVPWTSSTSRGKLRAISNHHGFSIKCVGVFDTVGSIGLPLEVTITHKLPSLKSILGFSNTELGEHVERAYQALAIHENRVDFNCSKFEQTEAGRRKGQVLKQCWFCGDHSDIGGGWHDHDLSDLSLFWMVANIEGILSLDLDYIRSLPEPIAPWGKQPLHDPRTGIFALSLESTRKLPIKTDEITHETVHPSVLEQEHLSEELRLNILRHPSLLCDLLPLEEEMRKHWPYVPGKNIPTDFKITAHRESSIEPAVLWTATREVVAVGTKFGTEIVEKFESQVVASSVGGVSGEHFSATSWSMNLAHETRAGAIAVLEEITKTHRHQV